ncbi:hypothetical protein [Cupriavidus necator]
MDGGLSSALAVRRRGRPVQAVFHRRPRKSLAVAPDMANAGKGDVGLCKLPFETVQDLSRYRKELNTRLPRGAQPAQA